MNVTIAVQCGIRRMVLYHLLSLVIVKDVFASNALINKLLTLFSLRMFCRNLGTVLYLGHLWYKY